MNMICKIFCVLTLVFMAGTAVYAKQPLIIDTDMGVDDAMAILYLLNHDQISVKAITIATPGSTDCLPARRNVLGLLSLMAYPAIPVACGRSRALSGNHSLPEDIRTESATLAGVAQQLPQVVMPSSEAAYQVLVKTLRASSQPVTILAIGPLTNLAELFINSPSLVRKVKAIYIMGGAIRVPGNIASVGIKTENQVAEWNIYLDPLAAQIVFQQPIPMTLIPLDATNRLPIDSAFYNQLKANHSSAAAKFIYQLLDHNLAFLESNTWDFWDPLAAAVASDQSGVEMQRLPLRVRLSPEAHSGQVVVDKKRGRLISVVMAVNQKQFKHQFLDILNKERQ